VNAIAGFDTKQKRHEAFSWLLCSWECRVDASFDDACRSHVGTRFLPPCIGRDRPVLVTRPLITAFMQPLDLGQAGRNRRQEPFMYDTYIIETPKGAAGIVVRDGRGFRFFAAIHDFNDLEGRVFGTPKEAEAAALRHVDGAGAGARVKTPRQFELSRQWSG
jgi:hypothetical protein